MNAEQIKRQAMEMEFFLSRIDPIEVVNRISRFRSLNIQSLSDQELSQEILNTLLINNMFVYMTNNGTYPEKSYFFRVRKLKSSVISEMGFFSLSDFWEPPQKCVEKYGRLNKIGESLLYTSPCNPNVAIKEMRLKENDWYALIRYSATKEIKVNIIGGVYDYDKMGFTDKKAVLIHELYNSYLRDEFSREVGEGTEYLYRVSESIAKNYFDLPREVQDAWCYSSVQDKQQCNVCFRPDVAHELLRLDGAMICKKEKDDEIRPRCIAIASEKTGKAEFYQLGTEMQRKIFPEIKVFDDLNQ